jgi:hypothetical protein
VKTLEKKPLNFLVPFFEENVTSIYYFRALICMRKYIGHIISFLLALIVVSSVYVSINHDVRFENNLQISGKVTDNQDNKHKDIQIGLPEGLPVAASENSSHILIKNIPEKTLNIRFWQRFVVMKYSKGFLGQLLVQNSLGRTKYIIIRKFQI